MSIPGFREGSLGGPGMVLEHSHLLPKAGQAFLRLWKGGGRILAPSRALTPPSQKPGKHPSTLWAGAVPGLLHFCVYRWTLGSQSSCKTQVACNATPMLGGDATRRLVDPAVEPSMTLPGG
ncbi:Hypothetical predicted protein [Podarcis lilfordi]|uniref:Uncharacterized protein n=1 Tax=Podarcis lilfordi TaxID=74358 RepID=A0AA35PR51_9SAUR|nr:Hypothetical predicted protein [Podarcis lilfordi]